jgi:hypothetical protein
MAQQPQDALTTGAGSPNDSVIAALDKEQLVILEDSIGRLVSLHFRFGLTRKPGPGRLLN